MTDEEKEVGFGSWGRGEQRKGGTGRAGFCERLLESGGWVKLRSSQGGRLQKRNVPKAAAKGQKEEKDHQGNRMGFRRPCSDG